MPDYSLENAAGAADGLRIIGIDEAGRGPWAGPVVAAAVWLEPARLPPTLLQRLDDSKALSAAAREAIFTALPDHCALAIGTASVEEIDRLNILQANLLAMRRAVEGLGFAPDGALVDGKQTPTLACPAAAVVKGDSRSLSIAAASIVAKVHRDRLMDELAARHPGYGWERNRGYGTAEHRAALLSLGVTGEHRRSFRPVREALGLTT